MKCHYSYYLEKGKKQRILIPMCMNVVNSNDIKDCICLDPLTEAQFERQRYNDVVNELKTEISELRKENNHLIEIIKQLK